MNNSITSAQIHHPSAARASAARPAPAADAQAPMLARSIAAGAFSLLADGAMDIEAEAGLVIRVNAGCLWVPHFKEQYSVRIGAGESLVVRDTGDITVRGNRGTQIELFWPPLQRSAALH